MIQIVLTKDYQTVLGLGNRHKSYKTKVTIDTRLKKMPSGASDCPFSEIIFDMDYYNANRHFSHKCELTGKRCEKRCEKCPLVENK